MTNINEVVSEPLRIKPLQEGETAVFRLVRAGVYDPATQRPATPQGHILPGQCNIRDPYDKNAPEKLILNITGYKPISRPGETTIFDPEFEAVRFDRSSEIVCTSEKNNTYFFLKLHNKNRDNKNRKPSAEVVFYEKNDEKELQLSNHSWKYEITASNLLINMTAEEASAIAKAINEDKTLGIAINPEGKEDRLRAELVTALKQNPRKFIQLSGDPRGTAEIMVDEAIDDGSIMFDDSDKRQWFWKRAAFEKGAVNICKVEEGNKPVPALVDFLMGKDGSKHLTELKSKYGENYSVIR